ncbi:MAG: hypothetical protein MZV63_01835 [Marinilabiliales bacterium]|nr:hypothetical protein [Marinilabiliales bacterium]
MKKVMIANYPEQLNLAFGIDFVGDYRKSLVLVNYLDDGHGTEEEEEYFGNINQVMRQFVLYKSVCMSCQFYSLTEGRGGKRYQGSLQARCS